MAAAPRVESAERRGRIDTTVETLEEDVESHDRRITRVEATLLLIAGYLIRDADMQIADIITSIL